MSSATLHLNWRESSDSRQILDAIERLFAGADREGKADLVFSQSKAKGIIQLQLVDNVFMVTRQGRTRRVDNQIGYWKKLMEVACNLYNMQVDKQALKSRFIQYRDVEPENQESLPAVKSKTLDVALTIGSHPASLGIMYEANGKIHIPQGVTIEITRVNDVFKYNNRDRGKDPTGGCQTVKMPFGEHTIPRSVLGLKVQYPTNVGININAVVVVEHRNLAGIIIQHDFALQDVLVVMTAGFPSGATKEFLHLLADDARLRDAPFLYFGDHDMQGFTIFQTLKYGSRASAWASAIMVCPRLQYVGPTKKDLLDSVKNYRSQLANPDSTEDEVRHHTDRWSAKADHKVKSKFDRCTPKDMEVMKSFESLGWLEHEPLAKREVDLVMAPGKAKFRLADLAQVDVRYIRQYFQTKLQQCYTNRPAAKVEPPAVRSQDLPSQATSWARDMTVTQRGSTIEADEFADVADLSQGRTGSESMAPGTIHEEARKFYDMNFFSF
ncbi:MAG: hypothetical protein Q9219_006478 [cf. Caloplaca sp. 3 TL-2023]